MSVQTVPSPLLGRPGAVAAEGPDAGVAWHYGDPTREQRLLVEGLAVVDLSHRAVVTVSGPDRLSWLHSITTQALTGLPPRTSTEALILSPKGHVEHALHVVDDGETTWITAEPGTADALVGWLRSMQFMLRVEITDRTDEFAVLGEPIGREGVDGEPVVWRDPWPTVAPGSVSYAAVDSVEGAEHPASGRQWRELLVPRAELERAVGDRPLAGTWASEALRVEAWRPRLGLETDHRTIPHEVDWLRTAVHLTKGCYRGQETVARVHNLGRPPRRLVMLHLDGSAHQLSPSGAVVELDGRSIGQVTTAARHHELGPIALALVKRNAPVDAVLQVDGVSAAQEVVVAP
ncbi:YgfZ/GcvT domain-containing protein [Angustibacter sp. McL0619]|uniref:CAF17-like 4Fe-4S cluster assembly/insertion protein YgfZ n=1 Tax=Angustibacter sp. McL0619 TaxID=3415676 RepID=UPI003CF989CD